MAEWRVHHYIGALLMLLKEKHKKENPVAPDTLCQKLTTLILLAVAWPHTTEL